MPRFRNRKPTANLNLKGIVGYARVSTREQAENFNALEQQIARLEAQGCDVVIHDVESGRETDRTYFQALLAAIAIGNVTQIVITRLDRLSRSLPTLRKTLDLMQRYEVALVALDDAIDMTSAGGKFHVNMLGALAEMESDRLSERINHGKAHFRAQKRASHAPFGYRIENARHTIDDRPFLCVLETREELSKAAIAVRTAESYVRLRSLNGALKEFTVTYGWSHWWEAAFRNWLTSPTLRGHLVYYPKNPKKRTVHYNTHEPIITEELGREIEEIIEFNRKLGGFGAKKSVRYPLSGLVVCARCGGGATITNSSTSRIQYYACIRAKRRSCDNSKYVGTDAIENAVIEALIQKAQNIAQIAATDRQPFTEPPQLKELRQQLLDLEKIPGTNSAIDAAKNAVRQQIKDAELAAGLAAAQSSYPEDLLRSYGEVAADPDYWASLSRDEKRALFHALVDRVVIDGAKLPGKRSGLTEIQVVLKL